MQRVPNIARKNSPVRRACAYAVHTSRRIERPGVAAVTLGDVFHNEFLLVSSGALLIAALVIIISADIADRL